MKTKEKLLELLQANRGAYFSGEDIAKRLNISRTAVWKAVKMLRSRGYAIDASTNRGYCLCEQSDILSAQTIKKHLDKSIGGIEITVFDEVDSTNSVVKKMANDGADEGCTVIADRQSAGRGRLGRSFFSPSGTGIYMSLLLRPKNYSAQKSVSITTMAAVAMSEAIEAVSDKTAQIKWVNDIFIDNKKVCGILTEAAMNLEGGTLEYAVLGIGINLYEPKGGFPQDIQSVAGAVFSSPQNDAKNRLAAHFLNSFFAYYKNPEGSDYAQKYRSRSLATGKLITVITPKGTKSALALGVDDDCRLLVRYEDGSEEYFSSGEISIRLQ